MKKIILVLIIIIVLYVVCIFNVPLIADKIGSTIGLKGFNEFIVNFKESLDDFFTKVPNPEEIKNKFSETVSGAIELRDDIKGGIETVKGGIETVKGGIDDVRVHMSGAVDTYETVKETVIETKESIESTVETIKDTTEKVSGYSDILNDSFSGTLINN